MSPNIVVVVMRTCLCKSRTITAHLRTRNLFSMVSSPTMVLLFLAGFSAHQRKRASGQNHLLPRPPWFTDLVNNHGGGHLLPRRGTAGRDASSMLHCPLLVNIEPGSEYTGPLTLWSRQDEFMWRFLECPYDGFTVEITGGVVLDRPLAVHSGVRSRSMVWRPFGHVLPHSITGRSLGIGTTQLEHRDDVCAALRVQAGALHQFCEEPSCMLVLRPVLHLIGRAVWRSLMFRASWFNRKANAALRTLSAALGMPGATWVQQLHRTGRLKQFRSTCADSDAGRFTADSARELADFLRSWAPSLLRASPEDARGQLQFQLETHVCRLQSMYNLAEGSSSTASRHKLDPRVIVKALSAAMHTRDRGKLRQVVMRGMECMFPDWSHGQIEALGRLPSASSLARGQILADAALCCFWRSRFAERKSPLGPMYIWADSSPQAGEDWLLSIALFIQREDLEACFEAARSLAQSVEEFRAAFRDDHKERMSGIAIRRHDDRLTLEALIHKHRQIPIALGSGHTGVEHKTRALCRKLFAEGQTFNNTQRLLESIRGLCTDLGVEASIPDVSGIALSDILPPWMRDELLPDGQRGSGLEDDRAQFLLPNVVLSPGILHICDNMMLDTDVALSGWSGWLPGFKAVAHLLHHAHLRQRFIGCCLHGTRHAWAEPLFNISLPSPAKWRWGIVVDTLAKLMPLRGALQAAWDPTRFRGGGGCGLGQVLGRNRSLPLAHAGH